MLVLAIGGAATASPLAAQDQAAPQFPRVDSITVEGNSRLTSEQIATAAGIVLGTEVTFRDVQRAIRTLFATGQFDDVRIEQREAEGRVVLVIVVTERPVLRSWTLTGPEKLSARDVRDRISLVQGRALDRAALSRSAFAIDSMYRDQGYYGVRVATRTTPTEDGGVTVAIDVREGNRVAIAQVDITGNTQYSDEEIVGAMASKPEGFWWFRSGRYEEDRVAQDVRQRLPDWYGDRGYVDFQVTGDSLVPDSTTGKAVLTLAVEEGQQYRIGKVEVVGNSRYSTEELGESFRFLLPGQLNNGQDLGLVYDRSQWQAAQERVQTLYSNSGYIRSQVIAEEARRSPAPGDSVPLLDLRLNIVEGQPAYINKINIVGNDVTHERVIREAIVIVPGELFNRDRLLRSYQNVSNLNFFEQPMAIPDIDPTASGDVDITFRVQEKRTGNINFGASIGQGTGLGGFLGLEEPNLFGRGKRGRLQWQFGNNINDFQLSYSDPAILESRISGTISVFNSRQRFIVGDLGRRQQEGGSLQIGLPWLGSRYSRVFASYGFQRINYSEGSAAIQQRFNCAPCSRSTIGLSFLRDSRIGLPFPVGGSLVSVGIEQNGGILGGTGDYQKLDLESRWYTPIGQVGGDNQFGGGVTFTLGITAKSGFITGNPGGFFTELYSLGGVQFGVPLRGYDEFSITPRGFDPTAASNTASADAFGRAYAAFTVEAGARISQSLYLNTFLDAGNVYRSVRAWDPTRLYRGAGVGAALVSPLGPLGVDVAYGFDKTDLQGRPAPGWQLHFRLGNFF
ncbi:MAG TPA: outer membrane protein assembly factor BamA [Gemmatimonadales bacterium]|nr:outer membrane protein assembly factor BamA [Gemmatimonadota bacterium]MCB9504874.1 outer membrane protein assembly factor BamA [Gemmatimonadales bacterium]MCB9518194.1 outer membrane protein assembly factor BamA [Gemmatimonadales bacterium]HPF62431.1 outer membrane protein assembly factor BamA [Gemmatimonadales bacterium]HRX19411.1 outer membrane protein assembly factor BamA [Gemmatimonadales bacterium]